MNNNKKNWFSQIITRPSPDEFDERFRAINSLAFRDALLAVVITIALLSIGIMQIPSLQTFSTVLIILALPSAFIVGGVTYIVSRILRGGWNWSLARYSALLVLVMSPFFLATTIVPDLASGRSLSPLLFVLPAIVMIIPILIIALSLRKGDAGASTDTPPSRSIRSLWQIILTMLIMTVCITVPTLGYRFFGVTSPQAAMGLGFLVFSLLLLGIIVARMLNLPLPRMLQNAPRLSKEEKATANRRMLMMSALLVVFSVIMLAGQLAH